MAPLKASVPKARRGDDGARVDVTAHAVGELNAGAVLWVAISITAFGSGVDGLGEVDDDVTLQPQIRKVPTLKNGIVWDVYATVVDDAVDHGFPAKCAKILRDIVSCKQLEV